MTERQIVLQAEHVQVGDTFRVVEVESDYIILVRIHETPPPLGVSVRETVEAKVDLR